MFRLESVWPEWHIVEQLGQGASGSVYMARRETMGKTFYSAVKIIKIPQEPAEAENLREMGLDLPRDIYTVDRMKQALLELKGGGSDA